MKLSKYEQETIINFNVAESDAVVFTRDKAVIRKLDSLVNEFPEIYKCIGKQISTRPIPCLNSTLIIVGR